MKTLVEIEWDGPEEKAWLCADNISLALHAYCLNTKFKVAEREDDVDKLRNLVAIQSSKGNVDQGEYMRGMANGLICALSIFTKEEPKYFDYNQNFKNSIPNEKN